MMAQLASPMPAGFKVVVGVIVVIVSAQDDDNGQTGRESRRFSSLFLQVWNKGGLEQIHTLIGSPLAQAKRGERRWGRTRTLVGSATFPDKLMGIRHR